MSYAVRSVGRVIFMIVIGLKNIHAAELPVSLDVLLDRYSVRAQTQLLWKKDAVVQFKVTNKGEVTLRIDGTRSLSRRTAAIKDGLKMATDKGVIGFSSDVDRLSVFITAEVIDNHQAEVCDNGHEDHFTHDTEIPPGTTIMVPVCISEDLVRPGENAILTITIHNAAGEIAVPAFAVYRETK